MKKVDPKDLIIRNEYFDIDDENEAVKLIFAGFDKNNNQLFSIPECDKSKIPYSETKPGLYGFTIDSFWYDKDSKHVV